MTTPLPISLSYEKRGGYDGIDIDMRYRPCDVRFYPYFQRYFSITVDPLDVDEPAGRFASVEDAIDYHLNTDPDVQTMVDNVNAEDVSFDFVIGEITNLKPEEYSRIVPLELRADALESGFTSLESRVSASESAITALDGRLDTAETNIISLQSWRADVSDNIAPVSSVPTNNAVSILGVSVPTAASYTSLYDTVVELKTKLNSTLNCLEEREIMAA